MKNFLVYLSLRKKWPIHSLRIMHSRKVTDWCATEPIPVLCNSGNRPLVHSLTDVSLVQCLLVAAGIGLMFSKGSGKVVRAREIFFGAHVEVIMLCMVQYAFYSLDGSNAA